MDKIFKLQEQIVQLKQEFKKNPDENNVGNLFDALFKLLKIQRSNKLYEDAIKTYDEVIDLLIHEECFNSTDGLWRGNILPVHYLGKAFFYYTEIMLDKGDLDAAIDNVVKALDINQKLYDDCSDKVKPILGRYLGNSYFQVARVAERIEKVDVVWEHLALYQDIYESNAERTNAERERVFLAECYENIGNMSKRLKDYSKANGFYHKEIQIYMDLADEFDSPKYPVLVGSGYQSLGILAETQGQLNLAKEYFEKSMLYITEGSKRGIYEENPYFPDECMIFSWDNLGNIEWELGNISASRENYLNEHKLCKEMLDETDSKKATIALISACTGLAMCAELEGEYALAKVYYEERLRLNEECLREANTINNRKQYADCLKKLGDVHVNLGDEAIAYDYYMKAYPLLDDLYRETADSETIDMLAHTYDILGIILREKGELDKATSYYIKSNNLFQELDDREHTTVSKQALATSYDNLAVFIRDQGDLVLAQKYYQKSFDLRQILFEKTKALNDWMDLATSYEHMGDIVWRRQLVEEAKDYYEKCVDIREKVFSQDNSIDTMHALGSGYIGLADLNMSLGNKTLAIEFHKKNMLLCEEIFKLYPTAESRLYLDESYIQVAIDSHNLDDAINAVTYINKAFISCEKLAAELKSDFALRNLACVCLLYGIICIETGEDEKAKELLERGLTEGKKIKKDGLYDSLVNYIRTEAFDIIDPALIES